MMNGLDTTDRQLLQLLQGNDKLRLAELSEITNVAASTLNDRIKRLQRQGVIHAYRAQLAPDALGLNLLAFVFVGWTDVDVEQRFVAAMAAEPAVQECHHITGPWNYLLKIRIPDTRELEAFLTNIVRAVEGVQRTETVIVMSSSKETSELPVEMAGVEL